MTAKYAVLCDNAVQAAFEKLCRLIRLIWSPLLPSVLRFFGMYPAMGVALYRRGAMNNLAR